MALLGKADLQQRIANAEKDALGQEILIIVSSKARANEREEAYCGAGKHESSRTVFVVDGANDGATEEENEELCREKKTN